MKAVGTIVMKATQGTMMGPRIKGRAKVRGQHIFSKNKSLVHGKKPNQDDEISREIPSNRFLLWGDLSRL